MLRTTRLACTLLSLAVLACCGGNPVTPAPPPPGPDFSLSASPVSASAVLGNSTLAVTISVVPEHGFNNSVDFTLKLGHVHGGSIAQTINYDSISSARFKARICIAFGAISPRIAASFGGFCFFIQMPFSFAQYLCVIWIHAAFL